ncbi:hypothetical protein VTJ04DRAFT_4982 [Mycothermus thermophilus]|uniref:uncharacterized protein n=1 Tax=Humicola insolens TaxID=85995 RepID=UPI0037437664
MSDKHLFPSLAGLVPKSLRGLITSSPRLRLDEHNRVVYDPSHPRSQVSIISGGGSGHEPAWSGYVGTNLLAAAVQGDVFASPSTRQILAAIDAVPSDAGTLLVITNYTGDCLHFGLAAEKTKAAGRGCKVLVCGDDVSIGRQGGQSLVGRRGLAAQIAVLKLLGAAAAKGAGLEELYKFGTAINNQIVSIAATLDHCHVPGRVAESTLGKDEIMIGTGPHNEPGYKKLSPAPSAAELVRELLRYCLDETDPERGYVHFAPGDETALVVSNFGGLSNLELGALVDELLTQLKEEWKVEPQRVYAGPLETSLNAPAFSVSVINLSGIARDPESGYSLSEIKEFFDLRTDTAWETVAGSQADLGARLRGDRSEQVVPPAGKKAERAVDESKDLRVDPALLERMVRGACEALIVAEPDLTRWDAAMGDGDCGLTLETGARAVLEALETRKIAARGSVVEFLAELEEIVETRMGGTLGGILGIFLVALRSAVEENSAQSKTAVECWAKALPTAIDHLEQYTPAKVGHRTVMDTLIPFAEAIRDTQSFEKAVEAAVAGANATKKMKPRLGRATYVGVNSGDAELPPDPGAWGAMVAIKGLFSAL